jgi:hypothetical protein
MKIRKNKLWRYGLALISLKRIRKKTNGKSACGAVWDWASWGAAVLRLYNDSPVGFMLYARGRRLTY